MITALFVWWPLVMLQIGFRLVRFKNLLKQKVLYSRWRIKTYIKKKEEIYFDFSFIRWFIVNVYSTISQRQKYITKFNSIFAKQKYWVPTRQKTISLIWHERDLSRHRRSLPDEIR